MDGIGLDTEKARAKGQDSVEKFKDRLNELTCRKMPGTVTSKTEKINQATRGN